jgi:hypothetical protein
MDQVAGDAEAQSQRPHQQQHKQNSPQHKSPIEKELKHRGPVSRRLGQPTGFSLSRLPTAGKASAMPLTGSCGVFGTWSHLSLTRGGRWKRSLAIGRLPGVRGSAQAERKAVR